MKRRSFLGIAGAAAAFPRIGFAQQTARKLPRVAIVDPLPIADLNTAAGVAAFNNIGGTIEFLQELARLGFVEGQTVTFDRYSAPNSADMNQLARAIVASTPDLIVDRGSAAMGLALPASTTTIPIVVSTADPVAAGIVSTLAPTRRNLAVVSGTAGLDVAGKVLSLLAEAVPAARHAAYVFAHPPGPLGLSYQNGIRVATDAATRLGVSLTFIVAAEAGDEPAFRDALVRAKTANADMIFFSRNAQVGNASAILARLALEYRIPAISNYHAFSRAGGLLSYGQPDGDQNQKVAQYAALILNGTDPGTLPVLQPQVFDLIVNLRTAKALGITIPPSILAQATQVIE